MLQLAVCRKLKFSSDTILKTEQSTFMTSVLTGIACNLQFKLKETKRPLLAFDVVDFHAALVYWYIKLTIYVAATQ